MRILHCAILLIALSSCAKLNIEVDEDIKKEAQGLVDETVKAGKDVVKGTVGLGMGKVKKEAQRGIKEIRRIPKNIRKAGGK